MDTFLSIVLVIGVICLGAWAFIVYALPALRGVL